MTFLPVAAVVVAVVEAVNPMRKLIQVSVEIAFLLSSALLLGMTLRVPEAFAESSKCENWQRPDGYDESWIPVSFRSICGEHSGCYEKADASWSACNSAMYSSLRKSCESMYPHASLSAASVSDSGEATGEASLLSCLQVADEFYSRVQAPGALKHFQAFQEKTIQKSPAL